MWTYYIEGGNSSFTTSVSQLPLPPQSYRHIFCINNDKNTTDHHDSLLLRYIYYINASIFSFLPSRLGNHNRNIEPWVVWSRHNYPGVPWDDTYTKLWQCRSPRLQTLPPNTYLFAREEQHTSHSLTRVSCCFKTYIFLVLRNWYLYPMLSTFYSPFSPHPG